MSQESDRLREMIGTRIREARVARKLTQAQVADMMFWSGGRALVSRLESGRHLPRADTLATLCEILDVSADYVLGHTKAMESKPL